MANFPWIKNYPEGIPAEIKLYEYESLPDLFEKSCAKFKDRVAFENMGATMTFAEVDRLSRDFAAYLQSIGLKKGDRIAIQMPNLLQFPVAFFGALRAGLTVVNTNPLYTPREMEHQFKDSGAKAIVIVENFANSLEKIIKHTVIEHIIVTRIGDMLPGLKGWITNFVVKNIKKMVPAYHLDNVTWFNDTLRKGASLKFTKPAIALEDNAVLQYTGGTTGIAKGAQLSHANIVAHNSMITQWFKPYLKQQVSEEIIITAIPMYHIFALTVNGVLMFSVGAKSVLITNPRDIPGFCKELKKHKFTIITGVNTLFNGLMNNAEFAKLDFSHLKGAVGGGMAVQDIVAKKWEQVTGKPLVEGYGLSETSPVLCCNPLDGTHRLGTIGLPMPSTEVAIFDDAGNQLPQGERGEICARGPQVMKGYWEKDNEGVFFEGGWFKTGDIGMMDPDGFFKIVDRKKDMIKVSGFNVFPNEIENVAAGYPKVLEVAAIGVPDEKSGEAIKLFVIKRDESLSEEELKKYLHENLTNYKVPKYVVFRKELPKTNVGKILRRALKEEEVK
ncbi:MAG TPA: AMP-binding protein [Cyclobacteriaceae bacterium]|nr:AMP-binding protein [Cyclobacteriaceae bacterium]HMX01667.1 AMP-binding protein [Cyclobacteriaceae bacterium]HMX51344.1 AMP-binding protein [Cyclobacteriaceae bacterium]HMY91529.1 AMP-binding protein [Cyclobacteriaceae bacterium]HNA14098.1 AMP-binding protein [Cyclobacteriaceae bacterium]